MFSVTQQAKKIKQPHGGYIPYRKFNKIQLISKEELKEKGKGHPSLVGLAVDYLTRFSISTNKKEVFKIALEGAKRVNEEEKSLKLLSGIKGLDKVSIENAYRISGFDSVVRAGRATYKAVENLEIDENTIENIKIMVNRSISFIEEYGPVIESGFTFEGGYTPLVSSGDGDFLTKDTLWEFKTISTTPNKNHTLQLMMYYLMGKKSIHKEFDAIEKIGIFNPRLNMVYLLAVSEIPKQTIDIILSDVIGY